MTQKCFMRLYSTSFVMKRVRSIPNMAWAVVLLTSSGLIGLTSGDPMALPLPYAAPIPFPEGEAPDGTKYKTAYKCEGEEMAIACESSETIQVIRANYGRFSIAICNKHGFTDWSVNCMSPRTTRILQNKCDGKRSCHMNVNSNVFGDPCPGTNKYVEVHYACSPQFTTTTTRRPLPPWFLENGPETWLNPRNTDPATKSDETLPTKSTSIGTSQSTATTTISEQETKSIFSISASSPVTNGNTKRKPILVTGSDQLTTSTTPVRIPITTPRPTTTSTTTKTSSTTTTASTTSMLTTTLIETSPDSISFKNNLVDYKSLDESTEDRVPQVEVMVDTDDTMRVVPDSCPPIFIRGINWNWTRSGDVAIVPCPLDATGLARWACLENGRWSAGHLSAHPDLSDCKSTAMTNLEAKVREEDPEDVVISTLAHLTSKMASRLYGGDLESTVTIMKVVSTRLQYLLQTQADSFYNKESYMQQVFQNVLRSASNLLSDDSRAMWWDLHPSQRMKTATNLLVALEENAFLLAQVTNTPEMIQESSNSIVMAINVLNAELINRTNGTSFPHSKPEWQTGRNLQRRNNVDTEDGWSSRWQQRNRIELSLKSLKDYISEDTLTKVIFFAHGYLHKILSDCDNHLKVHAGEEYASHNLNSIVISATLGQSRHVQLPSPVRIHLGHLKPNYTDPVCVYWDLELHGWSDDGCKVVESYEDSTWCECFHMTNFGLLMRPSFVDRATGASLSNSGTHMTPSTVKVLEIVTYVAVALSLVFLGIIVYRYHTNIQRIMAKYNCMGAGEDNKKRDKPIDGCAKSQSFYSGMNQLVHVASTSQGNSTMSTSPSSCKPMEVNRLSQYIARQDINRGYPGMTHCQPVDLDTEDEVSSYQPYLSISTAPSGHIITNPYDLRQDTLSSPDGLLATQHLRDAVYMSNQLVNLTNTLRASTNKKKKIVCQAGHTTGPCHHSRRESLQEDGDMVFRAVSPHGHVYWEIDPSRADKLKIESPQPHQEFHLSNMSRQSSSRYSDNYPLISGSPCKSDHIVGDMGVGPETTILVNPFADVQLISVGNGGHLSSSNGSSPGQLRPNDVRFSSLRGNKHQRHLVSTPMSQHYQHFGTRTSSSRTARMRDVVNTVEQWRSAQGSLTNGDQTGSSSLSSSDGSTTAVLTTTSSSSTSPTCQTNFMDNNTQQQVQLRDLRSIPASTKSTEYILAKLHNPNRASPINNKVITRSSPKQRKV